MKDERLQAFLSERVFPLKTEDGLFNQYRDDVKGIDRRGGAKIRRENLLGYLSSFKRKPQVLLVGEAPGPWGCRFSGIPFTGEGPLSRGELPFAGRQSSASEIPYSERSGDIFWDALRSHHPRFLVWNTIPFHPHRPGEPLSIRKPKISEVKAHLDLLAEIVGIIRPSRIAAIGRVAENALERIGQNSIYIRHPSHGGEQKFRAGIRSLFSNHGSD